LKLLFITSDKFPPFRVDLTELFGNEMSKRGHDIDYIMQSDRECEKSYTTKWVGATVWVGSTDLGSKKINRIKKNILSILNDCKLFKIVKNSQYDVVQVKDKFISALFALVAAKRNNIKFVYWLSYPFPEASLYRVMEKTARYTFLYFVRGHIQSNLLYKVILPRADHVFVQSDQMKKDIMTHGIPGDKLTPVPMGVSLDAFKFFGMPRKVSSNNDTLSVLYLGTLTKVRKLDFLLRVHKKVLDKISGVKLYMIGGSHIKEDEEFLVHESAYLGIDADVVFTGQLPRQEALSYVNKADVCVSPFFPTQILNSTSPTKLIEYMALGKAVVANDHPDQKKVIAQSGSGICVPYDEDKFAAAIVQLLQDPEKRASFASLGRQYVEKERSYTKIADFVEAKYTSIINEDT